MIPLYNAGSTKPHARFTPSAAEVPTIVQPGLAAIVPSSPWLHDSIPPAMFKLFVLWFAVLSLISVIQCTPTAVRRSGPSSKPESLVARGHCDFLCPYENVVGKKLSKSSADSGRLYCRYDVEETDDKAYCMYKRNTGELLSSSSPSECDQQAVFHCPGTKNSQEDMNLVPSQPKDSRSINLPRFVKARSMARRAVEANVV